VKDSLKLQEIKFTSILQNVSQWKILHNGANIRQLYAN